MATNNLASLNARLHPGVHGPDFIRRELRSDKPLRRALASAVLDSTKEIQKKEGETGMWLALFEDMASVDKWLKGAAGMQLVFTGLPDGLLDTNMEPALNFNEHYMFGAVLLDSQVAMITRFHVAQEATAPSWQPPSHVHTCGSKCRHH